MRIAVLAFALLPAAAIAGERAAPLPASHFALPATPKAQCQNARSNYAASAGEPVRMRRLDQEPRAGQYLGVLRMEDGCDLPVKIADEVGDKQR
ncbi:hypothetical protein P6144_18715 [Sphingomonas sp. HITSZ_GF]|uniref:hypothetical protein n=1 Tax=Sphingomonas sp. HITSZ_GF TaxID=3037247 RepID=UPI00240D7039|nr:hypothetical protein [Sphingomonas sp. HITSZ_GF]MDG2535701.1 hypothetical protein [Sphingomonas sp. HITSZ_GF]